MRKGATVKRPCGMPYCNNEASYRVPREHFPTPEFVCGLHSTSDDVPLDLKVR